MTSIKPRTARETIYQGDDIARLAGLDEAVDRAERAMRRAAQDAETSRTRLVHEADPASATRAAYEAALVARDEFAAEAEARGVTVVMHAVPRRVWRTMCSEHPPRPDNDADKGVGVNMDTMPDVLLPRSICTDPHCPACPEGERTTIEGDTVAFLESLSDYDYYDRLFLAAFALNRGSIMADPTQRLGSAPSQTSAATSN